MYCTGEVPQCLEYRCRRISCEHSSPQVSSLPVSPSTLDLHLTRSFNAMLHFNIFAPLLPSLGVSIQIYIQKHCLSDQGCRFFQPGFTPYQFANCSHACSRRCSRYFYHTRLSEDPSAGNLPATNSQYSLRKVFCTSRYHIYTVMLPQPSAKLFRHVASRCRCPCGLLLRFDDVGEKLH